MVGFSEWTKVMDGEHDSKLTRGRRVRSSREAPLQVADVMARHFEVFHPDAPLLATIRKMQSVDTPMFLVGAGEKLIGTITEHDILGDAMRNEPTFAKRKVRDVMTKEAFCIYEDEDLVSVVELMQRCKRQHAPVVDREQRIVGLLSLGTDQWRNQSEQRRQNVQSQPLAAPRSNPYRRKGEAHKPRPLENRLRKET